jgi:N4-gp56 family major capsid protein
MARTIIGLNDAKAVHRWSANLAYDVSQKSYFNQRFMGKGQDAEMPIQILTDLESDAGEAITYDLLAELKMAPIEGEDILEGKEESQKFYTDVVYIDQARAGVNTGGRMTRKRTLHNLRESAKRQQSSWWGRLFDELLFIYLSGSRGVNGNFVLPLSYTGRANNPLTAPDANHVLYGQNTGALATSDATLVSVSIANNNWMSLELIDRAKTQADAQGGGASGIPVLQPCKFNGEETFVCVMSTYQEQDLRSSTQTGQWLDIQKAAAAAEGNKSNIFKGSLGMYRGVVLHSHRNAIRFNNWGSGANLYGARALFMGSQAAVMAFGSPGTKMRFDWYEEARDNGDKVVITTSSIFGIKKCTFDYSGNQSANLNDFGLFALDTTTSRQAL